MMPDKSFTPKFQLLQYGDIVEAGDEWYDPSKDRWVLVDSEIGEDDDCFVGDPWDNDEMKPMRRRNPDYMQTNEGESNLGRDWKEDPQHPCDFD